MMLYCNGVCFVCCNFLEVDFIYDFLCLCWELVVILCEVYLKWVYVGEVFFFGLFLFDWL